MNMNLNRKIFFWIEQLKINPAERRAVTLLIAVFMVLNLVRVLAESSKPYEKTHYEEVEKVFRERVALVKAREENLLARYRPAQTAVDTQDTLQPDSIKTELTREPQKVNINTAGMEKLQSLPGIGPAYAARIIKYRIKHGRFTDIEQLKEIKGIGKKRLEKLQPFVKLKDSGKYDE